MRRLLIVAICLSCLAVPAQATADRGSRAKAQRLTEKAILDLNGVLGVVGDDLAEVSELPSVQAQDAAACEAATAPFDDERVTAVGAADAAGNVYCLSIGLAAPISIADRAYFLRTIGTRDLGVGDYQISRQSGLAAVGLGFPVIDDSGEVTGISLATLRLEWLVDRIARRASPRAVDNLVVDDHGTVLARSGAGATEPGTNLGRTKLVKAVLRDDFGTGAFRHAGEPVDAAWGTVPLSGGEIHVAISVPR